MDEVLWGLEHSHDGGPSRDRSTAHRPHGKYYYEAGDNIFDTETHVVYSAPNGDTISLSADAKVFSFECVLFGLAGERQVARVYMPIHRVPQRRPGRQQHGG